MVEPAGVALGALGALPVFVSSGILCLELFESIRSSDYDFGMMHHTLIVREKIFKQQYEIIIGTILDSKSLAKAMMCDKDHPAWEMMRSAEDGVFCVDFETPILEIERLLKKIHCFIMKISYQAPGPQNQAVCHPCA